MSDANLQQLGIKEDMDDTEFFTRKTPKTDLQQCFLPLSISFEYKSSLLVQYILNNSSIRFFYK